MADQARAKSAKALLKILLARSLACIIELPVYTVIMNNEKKI